MMPIASHVHHVKQALGTYRRALEEFESVLLELEETPDEDERGSAEEEPKRPELKVAVSSGGLPGAGGREDGGLLEAEERGDAVP